MVASYSYYQSPQCLFHEYTTQALILRFIFLPSFLGVNLNLSKFKRSEMKVITQENKGASLSLIFLYGYEEHEGTAWASKTRDHS